MEENKTYDEETTSEDIQSTEEDSTEIVEETSVESETDVVPDDDANTEDGIDSVSETITETEEETTEEDTADMQELNLSLLAEKEDEEIETYTEVPFLEKPLDEYNTTEGLLFILVLLALVSFVTYILND